MTMQRLLTPCIHRPYAFKNVVANVELTDKTRLEYKIEGPVYSEYASGPSLFMLADAVAESLHRVATVSLKSCQPV